MHRPKLKLKTLLNDIINEEISKFKLELNEVLEPEKTDYKIFNNLMSHNYIHDTYRFKTTNNNHYDVQFYKENVFFNDIELIDGSNLPDINNDKVTKGILIAFTPTEITKLNVDPDIIGTLDDPYVHRTNRNEQYEVLRKIIYLIQEFIKSNSDYYVYLILKNTYDSNLIIYNLIFEKVFKLDFNVFETKDTFYYIKINIIE